jgi:hypothetical protein
MTVSVAGMSRDFCVRRGCHVPVRIGYYSGDVVVNRRCLRHDEEVLESMKELPMHILRHR